MSTIREKVDKLAEKLPPEADWDDVMYEVSVRQKSAEGLRDGDESRVVAHAELKKRFRLSCGSTRRNERSRTSGRLTTTSPGTLCSTPGAFPELQHSRARPLALFRREMRSGEA